MCASVFSHNRIPKLAKRQVSDVTLAHAVRLSSGMELIPGFLYLGAHQ